MAVNLKVGKEINQRYKSNDELKEANKILMIKNVIYVEEMWLRIGELRI